MPLVYSLSQEQRSAKCAIVNRCSIGKAAIVYKYFEKTKYQKMLKQSCFGHLVDLNDLPANQIIHQLVMRLALPWSGDAEVFWFKVGRKKIRFSKQEFCLISGFLVGNEKQVDKSAGNATRLFKKCFPEKKNVDRGELWEKFRGMRNCLDRYKLGLIVILMYVVWSSEERRAVDFWLFDLVDNLDAFNKYPWGNESYRLTTHILRRDLKEILTGNGKVSYALHGFPHSLKVFALEAIPCVRSITEIVDANAVPRMLKWGPARRVLNCSVELILGTKEVEAIGVLVPTEAEKVEAYCYMLPEGDDGNVNEDSDVDEALHSDTVIENVARTTARLVEENKALSAELDMLKRRVELLEGHEEGADVNMNENSDVEDSLDGAIIEKLEKTAGKVSKKNKEMFSRLDMLKRRVDLLEVHEAETLEEEVGKETETTVELEKAPVEVNGPVTQSKVAKRKRVEGTNDADVTNEAHDVNVPLEPALEIYSRLKRLKRLNEVSFNARVTRSKAMMKDQVVEVEKEEMVKNQKNDVVENKNEKGVVNNESDVNVRVTRSKGMKKDQMVEVEKDEVVENEKKDVVENENEKEVVDNDKDVNVELEPAVKIYSRLKRLNEVSFNAWVTRSKAMKKDQVVENEKKDLVVENENEKEVVADENEKEMFENEKDVAEPEEEAVGKKMKMDATYDLFEELPIPLLMDGISLESAPKRFLIKLRYHHAYAEGLRNILEGASLTDQILNDGFCELRRRCKAYPNTFDQDAVVLDTNFLIYVTKLYDKKGRVEDIQFGQVFMNYVTGIIPEDSRPFTGCKTLYLPVLKDSHWFVMRIDLIERNVYVYDSLRGHIRQGELSKLLLPICMIVPLLFRNHVQGFENYSVEKLEVKKVKRCHSQDNGEDCGMFVFKFIEFMLAKMDLGLIKSKDMLKWRKRFVAELLAWDKKPEICT